MFDKELYLKILDAKERLEFEKREIEDKLLKLKEAQEAQEALIDAQLAETGEEAFQITETLYRAKTEKKSCNTETFIEGMQVKLAERFGDEGKEFFQEAYNSGRTVKETFNRTNFLKGLKETAKKNSLDFTEMIKAVEDNSSEKTISYVTKDLTKEK